MRTLSGRSVAVGAFVMLLASSPLTAASADVKVHLLAYQGGGAFYFMEEGDHQRNPTLTVSPNATVDIVLKTVTGLHNVRVQGYNGSEFVGEGDQTSYVFRAPASGTLEYWCDPHKNSGMKGKITIEEPPRLRSEAPSSGETAGGAVEPTQAVPGGALALVLLALAGVAMARRKR